MLSDHDFRRKLKMYMKYFLWFLVMVFQNEVHSFLFMNAPDGFQFLVVIVLAGCQKFDMKVRLKLLNDMIGKHNESGIAILKVDHSVMYSIFISVRLVGAELATICCSVVVGFVQHFLMTYQIIKDFRKVSYLGTFENKTLEKNMRIMKLIITELIEGITPIVYGLHIAMAYYGPNSHIFADVSNTYWSGEMKDFGPVFRMMSILFFVDTLSVIINSFLLWKMLNVNMIEEFCRVLTKYWFLIAVPLELSMSLYLATKDVNLGIDETHAYLWIRNEGRAQLINSSNDLTEVEKTNVLANVTFL